MWCGLILAQWAVEGVCETDPARRRHTAPCPRAQAWEKSLLEVVGLDSGQQMAGQREQGGRHPRDLHVACERLGSPLGTAVEPERPLE